MPGYPDHLISSQRRYGHFGTPPHKRFRSGCWAVLAFASHERPAILEDANHCCEDDFHSPACNAAYWVDFRSFGDLFAANFPA